ncbi:MULTISPECIES: APC family permease [Metallosphaera]|uniref:Amino acid/polyamine/organocation transporter, APC superfamily n=3 Tax=Metallosphaera TaxID=41980 RepID=A4YDT3_METS5|nr:MULTISPECIES: amino acid permease [Metallosphaera]ABP94585.1 amino acid/polyamine/organocation transporter, APC superfamily [Metallosphaera sedula DSM 5348]AIM26572.1 amino acid/polyamine/organocation transporter, APC superfamily [Metallosphaera sedula]AKV73555.1 amino acid transporter [Metallosphaera sedula]AKV75797.1 amino acid transporter [Metallosphaera sedula]AKV78045.1 amino acid transporter [Metallosphaera sedula]
MKKLTFWQALFIGLGNIIGAGIFVMAGATISAAGPGAILAFVITAIYAMTVGLNSAELSSIYTDVEGGVYSFTLKTLGGMSGFLVGWFRVIAYSISGAATALGFSGYMTQLGIPSILYYPMAVILIVVLLFLNYLGLRLVANVETILVLVNLFSLIMFTVSTLVIAGVRVHNFTPFLPHGVTGLFLASNLAFFAYSGFNTIATLTPSTENGEKVIPRAIVWSLVITSLIYISVIFAMVDAVPYTYYGLSSAPLSLTLSSIHAPSVIYYVIGASALIATVSVTLSIIVAGQRTLDQLSKDFQLPVRHPLILVGAIMVVSLFLGNVESIALASNFGIVFSYMLTGLEVMISRHRGLRGVFRSPGYPILQLISTALSAVFLISLGIQSLEIGVVTLFLGILVYEALRETRLRK